MGSPFQLHDNESDGDFDYSEYYDYEDPLLAQFGLCEKQSIQTIGRIFLLVFYSLICILGIIINTLLFFILMKSRHLKKTFPICMVISDGFFAMTLPFWAHYAHREWIFGVTGCKAVTAIYVTSMYSSILFLTCICVETYWSAVWTPAKYIHKASAKDVVFCAAVWILSLLAASPHWTFADVHEFDGQKLCTYHIEEHHMHPWKLLLKFQMNIFGFLIPLLIMFFCCLRVYCAVDWLKSAKKSKAAHLVMVPVGAFFLLWFPYNVASFLHSLQMWHLFSDCTTRVRLHFAIQLTECIAFSHCFINPVLLVFLNKRLWKCVSKFCVGTSRKMNGYSLESSENTDKTSVHGGLVELKALPNHIENTH